jgi:PKD repeat protein
MKTPRSSVSRLPASLRRMFLALVLVAFGMGAADQPVAADTCDATDVLTGCGWLRCAFPATPAPQNLWGDLEPVDSSPLPTSRDSTKFNEFDSDPRLRRWDLFPWFMGIDVENGFLIAGLAHRIQIWNTVDPANPQMLGEARLNAFPQQSNNAEIKLPLRGIDAPAGTDTTAAMVGVGGMGIGIFNLSNKSTPKLVYQNFKKDAEQVYAATLGGVHYAFMAANGGESGGGLYAFNMTAALQFNGCSEGIPAVGETTQCPGVYVGKVGNRNPVNYVHGVDQYVVLSAGAGRGLEIWNVANPAAPQLRLSALNDQAVYGVAMWRQGSSYYLALRGNSDGRIYDVSCITNGLGCASLGGPLWSQTMDTGTQNFFVTSSRSGDQTPFVYFGSDNSCGGGVQREWLFDVSNPSNPHDLSPQGYWQWYYRGSQSILGTGFNRIMPRGGKFSGNHFYRAALAVLDIHSRAGGVAPTADFTWSPTEVYEGTSVSFQDTSSGNPDSWDWTFTGGTPGTSTAQNPTGVTFSTAGPQTITLVAENGLGTSTKARTLTVLPAAPAVSSVGIAPASPLVCQPITFTATGVTGRPPLTYGWEVRSNATTMVVATGSGNPFTWSNTVGITPGDYTATVTVTNNAGSTTKSGVVTIAALPQLPSTFLPTHDPFAAGTVQFHVAAVGATEWSWDFGDGAGFGPWTNDPVSGPNPVYTYTTIGSRTIRVKVRNCVEAERTSGDLTITIVQTEPLKAMFQASLFCPIVCLADTGTAIAFADSSTGAQTYDYDWNGNGFTGGPDDQLNQSAPVTTHTYNTAGDYTPKLRVRRGAEEAVFTHKRIIVSLPGGGGGGNPSISISGPSSGAIGAALGFSASGTNCTPTATGWTWSVSGGSISGSSNTSSISVSWSTAGTKTVQASNSGCGIASTTKPVTITGGNDNGTLTANFTFTPTAPSPNQAVSFDAGTSTGSPSQYSWTFGDGGNATGRTVSHTFTTAGTYSVKLTVTKPGSGTGCFGGTCLDDETKAIVVGTPVTPLDATYTASAPCTAVGGFDVCTTDTGTSVTLTAASTDTAASYTWDFGDGSSGTGRVVSHSWNAAGSYPVRLTVAKGAQSAFKNRTFQVNGPPPPDASYTASVQCTTVGGFDVCPAQTGVAVTLTATTTDGSSYSWDFGDGGTGSGRTVSHTWNTASSYAVKLTVVRGGQSAFKTRTFQVSGPPPVRSVVLPWIAQTRGALVQSSDLYVHNPTATAMEVKLRFLKRGQPEANPPQATRTVAAGATLYLADILGDVFDRENVAGFVTVETGNGTSEPVITSFNTTFQDDGSQFGQTVPGVSMSQTGGAATAAVTGPQHLIGLNDTSERLSYFGISNPTDAPATYRLRFFNAAGQEIGQSAQFVVPRFGQRQFQHREIANDFGVSDVADFRVEIETVTGGLIFPYAANLRLPSEDPSFVVVGNGRQSTVYLVGALSTPGLLGSRWQTDVVMTNPSTAATATNVTFTRVGFATPPTSPVRINLQPGETQRLSNVVEDRWNIKDSVGFLRFDSTSPTGIFPIIQGESYDNARPALRFGQSMTALTEDGAAGVGKGQYLAGLRQDDSYRTTLWLLNPSETPGAVDLVYRALDGTILGRLDGVALPAGRARQLRPSDHPLPANGVANGFTLQVLVRSGKALAAAQVVNNATNDPAYISGETR